MIVLIMWFFIFFNNFSCAMEHSDDAITEYKKPDMEDIAKEIDLIISLQHIDISLEKIRLFIKEYQQVLPELRSYLSQLILPQWREEPLTFKKKPRVIGAVGFLVAWFNKNSKKCHYYNQKTKKTRTIRLKKKIKFLDIAPNASKIAIASRKKIVIWCCNKNKEAVCHDCESVITALNFYKYGSVVVGMKNGSLTKIHYKNKNHRVSELRTKRENALISLATFENLIIAQDAEGAVYGYRKINRKKNMIIDYKIKENPFAVIIPFGVYHWTASDAQGKRYNYEQINQLKKNFNSHDDGGIVVCCSPYMSYVIFQANDSERLLKCYSSRDELLDEVPVLPEAYPLSQKPLISASSNHEDWVPLYLIYRKNKKEKWELLSKRKPTLKQLAFQLVLSKAYNEKRFDIIQSLFLHPQFKIFGLSYTRRLLLDFYKPKNFLY